MGYNIIALIGPPCSGKSTIGKIVADNIGARYISSGDIARKMAENDTNIKDNLNSGNLAPEDEMRSAILDELRNTFNNITNTVILDGFPRFGEQARWLGFRPPSRDYRWINPDGGTISVHYVLIYATLSTVIERSIHRNRSDDKSFEKRIKYYYNTTLKDLGEYVEYQINADELSAKECADILEKFIKEVT